MDSLDGGLYYKTAIDNSQLLADANQSKKILHGIGQDAVKEGSIIDSTFAKIGAAATGVFAAAKLKDFAMEIVNIRGEFQKLQVSFNTLLGSKEKADALMSELIKTAATTPFSMTEVAGSAKQLLAYGVAAKDVNSTLIRLGDIAAGLSIPMGDLAYLYGTTMTQGRLYTQDLRQFMGRGIPLAEELAKQFGVQKEAVADLVTAGKVGFPEVEKAIISMTNKGSKFGGLMEAQSHTISGQISNIEDSIEQMFNQMGKSSEGVINAGLKGVSTLVENWESIGKALLTVIEIYGVYKAALITINALQKANMVVMREAVLIKQSYAAQSIILSNAEAAEQARTNLLTIAKLKLTAVQNKLNMAIAKNPYVAVALAVAGLVVLIYNLATAETIAEKAQKDFNKTMDDASKKRDETKSNINSLVEKIKSETETIYEQVKAWNELKKAVPDKFGNMSMSDFQNLSASEIDKMVNESLSSKDTNDFNKYLADAEKRVADLKKQMIELGQVNLGAGASGAYTELSKQLQYSEEILKNAKEEKSKRDELAEQAKLEAMSDKEKLEYLNNQLDALKSQKSEIEKQLPETMRVGEANKNISDIVKGIGTDIFDVNKKWGDFDWQTNLNINNLAFVQGQINAIGNQIAGINNAKTAGKSYSQAKTDAKTSYDNAKKEYADILKNQSAYSEADYQKAKQNLSDTKKAYEDLGGIVTTKTRRSSVSSNNASRLQEEALERSKQIKQYAQTVIEQVESGELDIRQSQIDSMDDSFEKTKAQIDLNYDKLIAENTKRQKDMISALTDEKVLEWQQKNPKATKTQTEQYRASLNLTVNDLSGGQIEQLKSYQEIAKNIKVKAEKEALEDVLKDVQTYEQQRLKITEEYAKKRNELYNHDNKGNLTTLKTGVTVDNVDELDRQEQDALKKVDENFAQRESTYQSWVDSITSKSLTDLQILLMKAKVELDVAKLTKDGNSQDLAVAYAKVNQLEKAISKSGVTQSKAAPTKKTTTQWTDLYKVLNETGNEFEKLGDQIGGTAGTLIKTIGKISASTLQAINGIQKLFTKSTDTMAETTNTVSDGIKKTAEVTSASVKTVETASVILAVISAAIEIAETIIDLFDNSEYEQAIADVKALNEELERNKIEIQLSNTTGTIFGDDLWGNFQKNVSVAQDALEVFNNTSNEIANSNTFYKWFSALSGTTLTTSDAIKNMSITLKKGFLGIGKKTSTLGELFPDLFNEDGTVNMDSLNELINSDTFSKLSKQNQAYLQQMADDWRTYQDAVDAVNSYISDIFGDLGNALLDDIVTAFEDGTSAAESFGDSVGEILEKLIEQMVYTAALEPILESYKTKLSSLMTDSTTSDETKQKALAELFANLTSDVEGSVDYANELLGYAQNAASNAGIDIFSGDSTRTADQGTITSVSQDSFDEYLGRITAIQGHTFTISENSKSIVEYSKMLVKNTSGMLQHLSGIETNTDKLHSIESGINDVKTTLDDISIKGVRIRT